MLTFYVVPFRRNISFKRELSRVTNLPSRIAEQLVMRPLCFRLTMLLVASEGVCHDVA